jgi:threonine 3-dehydrogenase
MQAVVKLQPGPGASLREVDRPAPGAGEILVRVRAAAICGTDSHIYEWNPWAAAAGLKVPGIIGHECSGDVVQIGPGVSGLTVGDHVSVETHIPCGTCYQCQTGNQHICSNLKIFGLHTDGCFADYAVVPAVVARHVPGSIPWEQAALFEPAGVALHGVEKGAVGGCDVAVIGCGPIGLFAVLFARVMGAVRIFAIDIAPGRLALAEKVGATEAVNPKGSDPVQAILRATGGRGVDVVLESSGSGIALQQGLGYLRKGGRAVLLGLPGGDVPLNIARDVVFKEATVMGVHGRHMWRTWNQLEGLVATGRADLASVITHQIPLVEFEHGFELAKGGASGKVVLLPEGAS